MSTALLMAGAFIAGLWLVWFVITVIGSLWLGLAIIGLALIPLVCLYWAAQDDVRSLGEM